MISCPHRQPPCIKKDPLQGSGERLLYSLNNELVDLSTYTWTSSDGCVTAIRSGNGITVQIDYSTSARPTVSSTAPGWKTIATLPEMYRPTYQRVFSAGIFDNLDTSYDTNMPINTNINVDGNVQIYLYADHLSSKPIGTLHYTIVCDNAALIQNPANVFSADEQAIGMWIDGKTLYRKTVDCGTMPKSAQKDVAHNIANVDTIMIDSAHSFWSNGITYNTLPFSSTSALASSVQMSVGKTHIHIVAGVDRSGYSAMVTVFYSIL